MSLISFYLRTFSTVLLMIFIPVYGYCGTVGVGTHFQGYDGPSDVYLEKIKGMGFFSFREDYPWSKIEKEKGVFMVGDEIKKTDSAFLNAKQHGLEPILILDYGNKFYNNGDYPRDPDSIKAYVNYVSWTAEHFKGKVKYYEIWNEWTNGTGMARYINNIPAAEVYFNLVKATSQAIKSIDPTAVILAGGFNPLEQRAKHIDVSDGIWFSQLLKMGILNYIDGVSIHTYSYLNGNRSLRSASGNLNFLDQFHANAVKIAGREFPFYITEIGITNYDGPGGMNQKDAADYLKDYINEARSRSYIKGIWIYDLMDDGKNLKKRDFNFGLLNRDLSPKLSAVEVQNFLLKNK